MPGEWDPCFKSSTIRNAGERKRRANDSMTTDEFMEEEMKSVSPKRSRCQTPCFISDYVTTTTTSATAISNNNNCQRKPAGSCCSGGGASWRVQFSAHQQTTNNPQCTTTNSAIVVESAMETDDIDEATIGQQGFLDVPADEESQGRKTPERQCLPPSSSGDSPEICRQLYMTGGYSPNLINNFLENRRINTTIATPTPTNHEQEERRSSTSFGCHLHLPLRNDFY